LAGVLGLNDTINRSSPVQVGALTTWSLVSTGSNAAVVALKTDGTMWAWGVNGFGQLGQNDTINRSSPVQIGALTTWSKIAFGIAANHAIKTDGTLWGWGRNNYGNLGIGDTINRSSPVQVGALNTWTDLALRYGNASFALKKS
jgi:alpha-tubulin suppressor-like RCC1 family protein